LSRKTWNHWKSGIPHGSSLYSTIDVRCPEGALTHQRIWETFQNTDSSVFGSDAGGPARVQKFLRRGPTPAPHQTSAYSA